ncbi:MAG TPA: RIP metalloprotease RseP [Blastocatellia bacterium]|nr:RIP metalloprotease RseP [Blastocatellia bacterium]
MESFLQMAVAFVLVLGAMIVIHELGHFLVAKFFGIRVEVFSVGFGKRLWGIKRGDTDYRLSLIPLGGYVKMAGENLDEQVTGAPDEFMSKPKWQRFLVALAGPAMNILTALVIPAVMVMIHFETPAYVRQPAVVNAVGYDSPAEEAGLRRGDVIVKIDGHENPTWRDVEDVIAISPDQDVPLTIKRDGKLIETKMHIGTRMIDTEKIGEAGLEAYLGPNTKLVTRGVEPGSPADKAGFKAGDQILAVNGKPVKIDEPPPAGEGALDPNALYGASDVIQEIQNANGQPLTFTVRRDGETLDLTAAPELKAGRYMLGFYQAPAGGEVIESRLGPVAAIKHSWELNMRILRLTGTAMQQIFVGQRSARDTFTGPVGIFVLSGQAAEEGAQAVFQLMAILSLNLGIFNLLPIPVLDGGLIFMLGLEAVLGLFGLPLTLRIKEKMIQVGFVMLMLLMGFVIFNDISKRIPSRSDPAPQAEQQQKQPAEKPPAQE